VFWLFRNFAGPRVAKVWAGRHAICIADFATGIYPGQGWPLSTDSVREDDCALDWNRSREILRSDPASLPLSHFAAPQHTFAQLVNFT
jgi:hypothetical protein